ncbi:MAG: hypothetical protein O8C61_05500 [Candidatus Methanoperedens sp.]|nr:hypothetical protein [Candidatus Methanoperedens sp.]
MAEEGDFTLDRVVLDRSAWVVYFPSAVKNSDNNFFDPDLIDRLNLEFETKISKFKGKGKERVLYFEHGSPKKYFSWELRLRQSRSMNVYFNFNRYFFQKFEMEHDIITPVIHDDNFLPIGSKVTLHDFLDVYLNKLPQEITAIFEEKYNLLWPHEYAKFRENDERPVCKCVTLEVAREMKPLSVDDIRNDLFMKGVAFKSFNQASKTMYFGEKPDIDTEYFVDDTVLYTNLDAWNWKEPYQKIQQGKLYQKSIDLVRFEITMYDGQIDFNSSYPEEDIKFTLDEYAETVGIIFRSTKREFDSMIINVSEMLKLDPSCIDMILKSGFSWQGKLENRILTNKLLRRKLIIKTARGQYVTNPAFLKMFEGYIKPKEENKYVPRFL